MSDTSIPGSRDAVTPSPVPRRTNRPSWLDLRLVAGVVLVLAAVIIGAQVVSTAERREPVWALAHDVAAGTVLQSGDLRLVRVQLGEVGSLYLPSREAAVGKAARQSLRSGELLQRADLAEPEQGVTVTIPIRPENAPKVARGDRITVWVTTKTCRAVVILSGVAVQDVRQGTTAAFGTKAEIGVVVRLAQADAQRLVSALDLEGAAIRMGVLAAGQQPADTARDLSACSAVPR